MRTKLGSSVPTKMKHNIWPDITRRVNATGNSQLRTQEQVKLCWNNLKQTATKDHCSESQIPQTGNKPFKEVIDILLHIIGGERSQALHGLQIQRWRMSWEGWSLSWEVCKAKMAAT